MRIAFCHFDLAHGPVSVNMRKLKEGLRLAGEKGADWVLTPETAVQGFFFYKVDPERVKELEVQPAASLEPLLEEVRKYGFHLFLGCGEAAPEDGCNYNSCLVFRPDGSLLGRHRKNHSHEMGSEAWVKNDTHIRPMEISGMTVGVMVCADAYFEDMYFSMKDQGAELLVDVAAWPPSESVGNPADFWVRCTTDTQLPLMLCNQTGSPRWLDMQHGQSVYMDKGEMKLAYSGKEALLIMDWDEKTKQPLSQEFEVYPMDFS